MVGFSDLGKSTLAGATSSVGHVDVLRVNSPKNTVDLMSQKMNSMGDQSKIGENLQSHASDDFRQITEQMDQV